MRSVPIFKDKGDVQNYSNCRELMLISHLMNNWESDIEAWLRIEMMITELQYGVMLRRITTDVMFALRVLMERYR